MKTAPEAVSFPMSHLSGQGNSFSSARAASGFALTVSIVNQASGPIISFSSSVTKTFSIFRIGRVSFGLFLAGKMFHREAVSFDSPPTLRGCMWPGLDRHRLIGFVGIVSHFPFASPLFRTFRAEQRSISI